MLCHRRSSSSQAMNNAIWTTSAKGAARCRL
ncbi:hypothetical protein AB1W24_08020 [Bordetella avium]